MGGILNTGFNLHGEPNVCSPQPAIRTVDLSGLNYLTMGDYLLEKEARPFGRFLGRFPVLPDFFE